MADRDNAVVDILVEIRAERPLSIGVMPAAGFGLDRDDQRVAWLPRAEIIHFKRQAANLVLLTLPKWLADRERLTAVTEDNADQGSLL
jgi:hypothetical protein